MPDRLPDPAQRHVADRLLPEATRRLVRSADALADEDHAAPSGLPGWTRAHVLAHLALNAEGLAGALMGIVEGRRVPMYSSQEARDGDIDELAAQEAVEVRARLLGGCTQLADALAAVPHDAAGSTIERVPGGRSFPAADVPLMRLGEVEIHHVDLAAGYDRTSWSPGFCGHVLDALLTRGAASGPFTAYAVDLDRTWQLGAGGPRVSGTGADLAWWATGRGTGDGLVSDGGPMPQMGAW